MRLDSVTIENYKVFLERQSIEFAPGFNLLVGSNNSGKTTAQLVALGVATSKAVVEKAMTDELGVDFKSASLIDVHGANVLKAVFATVTNSTVEFRKTRDVPI